MGVLLLPLLWVFWLFYNFIMSLKNIERQCEPGGRELTQREEEEGGSQAAGAEVVLDVSPAVGAAHPASTEVRQLGSGQDIYSLLG